MGGQTMNATTKSVTASNAATLKGVLTTGEPVGVFVLSKQ